MTAPLTSLLPLGLKPFLQVLGRAVRGESPYVFGISLPGKGITIRHVGTVTAISPADALAQILNDHPIGSQITLGPSELFVGIQRFVAHPCRAARWVFFYRQMLRRERKAMQAIFGVQSRQSVLGEVKDRGQSLEGPVTTDAQGADSLPDDEATTPVALRKTVAMDDLHLSTLPNSL